MIDLKTRSVEVKKVHFKGIKEQVDAIKDKVRGIYCKVCSKIHKSIVNEQEDLWDYEVDFAHKKVYLKKNSFV